ncbi:carbamoyltransferase HypF [Altericista sp. CCNU0014]|uniref:carbamoyltransferase HypF n=1 Tax=Altericista sp. CCNU0014 TaxID=3082949 RepID=UPI00384F9EE8
MIRPVPLSHPLSRRLHLQVRGMVQGVGFRPFVYTLATELGLGGWVRNNDSGVDIEVEGSSSGLTAFVERLERDRPAHAILSQLETDWLAPCGYERFEIQASAPDSSVKSAWILPDLATCPACLREIFDPRDRRYQYPFTNCTHCGPRYSILTALPYDRPNTTMQSFPMCPDCQREYDDPRDRRFHAQPNACPACGPRLALWDRQGKAIASGSSSSEFITLAADRIRQGEILALKGLGGFHLIVDARNEGAVRRLRDRKHRPVKPFAVMYPTLDAIRQDCRVSPAEADCLTSAAAPIVLLQQLSQSTLAALIAPHQATVGAMLPSTPLHHLLLAELGFPIVATSGNHSRAPICADERDAIEELGAIADIFLVHNRPIAKPVDDSVVRVMGDRPMVLRRSRGYAPSPLSASNAEKEIAPTLSSLHWPRSAPLAASPKSPILGDFEPASLACILAVGGHLKNTVALSIQGQILASQHLGDLDEAETAQRFHATIAQLLDLYAANPVAIAHDAHPDYASTQFAQALSQSLKIPVLPIQHHYAHVLSGMLDNDLEPPVLGIAWDGTGYGLDGTLWGSEFLDISHSIGFQRVGHLRTFPLPGGDRAAREPRRAALGLLYEAFGEAAFDLDAPTLKAFQPQELKLLRAMLQKGINSPRTSSMGRLFDAIASLLGLCHQSTFEGEAAMQLESALEGIHTPETYPYELEQDATGTWIVNWQPMLVSILNDLAKTPNSKSPSIGGFRGRVQSATEHIQPPHPIGEIATKFHNTLVETIAAIAHQAGIAQVVLTGGCFQNRYLLERSIRRLRDEGFAPHWHHRIPPNDGGLAVGQILGAHWVLEHSNAGGAPCV